MSGYAWRDDKVVWRNSWSLGDALRDVGSWRDAWKNAWMLEDGWKNAWMLEDGWKIGGILEEVWRNVEVLEDVWKMGVKTFKVPVIVDKIFIIIGIGCGRSKD